jgi:hypothetical protein
MKNKDFIPGKEAQFNEWQKTLVTYAAGKMNVWNIPQADYTELISAQTDFTTKYALFEKPETRTKAVTTAKTEALKSYKKILRQFTREHLTNNRRVTDMDRRNMQLPIHDTHPSTIDPPKTMVIGKVDFSVHQQHTIHAADSTGKLRGDNAHGFEVWRKVGGAPPASDADFEYAGFSASTKLVLDYPLEKVGETVYYRFRWVNERNRPGPWSESVISAVIA